MNPFKDPVFKGCTRPAMLWGVPLVPFLMVGASMLIPAIWALLASPPVALKNGLKRKLGSLRRVFNHALNQWDHVPKLDLSFEKRTYRNLVGGVHNCWNCPTGLAAAACQRHSREESVVDWFELEAGFRVKTERGPHSGVRDNALVWGIVRRANQEPNNRNC